MAVYSGAAPFTLDVAPSGAFTLVDTAEPPPSCPDPSPPAPQTLRHRVVDFHFGCALGIGFISGKDGGTIPYTIASGAVKGAASVTFSGATPLAAQLFVVLGTDGQYYTAAGLSNSGGVCVLCDPLPCDVAAGQNAWSFWDNNAHPNAKGYAAIADHALRQDFAVWRKVWGGAPTANAPATVAAAPYNSVMNPGSQNSGNGWVVTPSGAGGGALWQTVLPSIGDYRLSFECTRSAEGSGDIDLTVHSDGVLVKSYAIKTVSVGRHDVDFTATGPVVVKMTRASVPFYVSNATILTMEETGLASLDHGKHMVFGDSWVADPVGPAARLSTRLSSATILKSGVGGNKASDLLARFAADVASVPDLDFVWVVVGTNDIAQGVTPETFASNLFTLINKIQTLGAVPIILTPYTGCTDIPARIDLARRYVAAVPYWA